MIWKLIKLVVKGSDLSDLIEKCGDRFLKLVKDDKWIARSTSKWNGERKERFEGLGDSPEEAVINLWLQLK